MFRRTRLLCLTLALSSLSLGPVAAQEDRLDQIAELAAIGANRFALHLLDRFQPAAEVSPDIWIHWERQRTLIYIDTNAWDSLLDRAGERPDGLPEDFQRWQDTRVAEALLKLGETKKARDLLLSLIWRTPPAQRGAHFARWRELIIRTYLAQALYDDAHVAWLRYRLDYSRTAPADNALSAEVLLRIGQISEAATYLESPRTGREHLLAAIIESELGLLSASEMWQRVESLLAVGRFDPTLALEAWSALQSASIRAKDITLGCQVLERALTLSHQRPVLAQEARISGDGLWKSYETVASAVANSNQLLVGRFDDWLALIDTELVSPVAKRAILAFLVLNGSAGVRETAEPRLIGELQSQPQGGRIVQALYLSSSRAHLGGDVPEIVRYPLVELALRDADLELAQHLSDGLGRSSLRAKLIQARIRLRESPQAGSAEIRTLLAVAQSLPAEEISQFHVAINELGGILPDDEVLHLLEQLRDKAANIPDTGEAQLSIGAIEMRQLKFQQAAMSFLTASRSTSDGLIEQQALLQAARALSLARMNEQAREIYQQVLTKPLHSDQRQQVIRELERLGILP